MNPEEHVRMRDLLGGFALDRLDQAERSMVQAHLDGCPGCMAELATILPAAHALAWADPDRVDAPQASPPPALERSIMRTLDAHSQPPRLRRSLSLAAAALAIGAAGVGFGYQVAPKPPQIPLEPVSITANAADVKSTAAVVAHSWGMEIKLSATGFTSGRRYRVVVTRADGQVSAAGEFVGVGARTMQCNLTSAVLRTDARQFQVIDEKGVVVATARL